MMVDSTVEEPGITDGYRAVVFTLGETSLYQRGKFHLHLILASVILVLCYL